MASRVLGTSFVSEVPSNSLASAEKGSSARVVGLGFLVPEWLPVEQESSAIVVGRDMEPRGEGAVQEIMF